MNNRPISYLKAKEQLPLNEKVGQLFMPAAFINDTEEEIKQLENLIIEKAIGGICFFHSRASAATNYEGKKEVVYNKDSFTTLRTRIQRYQSVAKYPLLIAIDAEWGLAMRIENTPQYPYAITLGAIQNNTGLIFEVGKNIAKDCKTAGIHFNLSPVVDINNNPDNPVIGYRSFGEDKNNVIEKATAFVKGMQSEGILSSIKHFPGHGDTATDSHLALPLIDKSKQELTENELNPFQKLIDEGVDSVMVGHLSVPALANGKYTPSSISKVIIKDVLRDEMRFGGVVISDALNMYAVSKNYPTKGELEWLAFDAGNDILCFAEHISEGIETILKNASLEQIEESFERVWKLKEKAITNDAFPTPSKTALKLEEPHELNQKLAENSLTLFKGSKEIIRGFRTEGFTKLQFGGKPDNPFFQVVSNDVRKPDNILLALFPPQVKPTDNFGFSDSEISAINTVLNTKNVVLYLFGNPYALKHFNIKNAKAVVIAYQDFKEFQEVAAQHFLGSIAAKGKLPVTIQ
ncbi:glycoside hydrolase family 3 protein [Maribacter algicola]|uniref:Glycoside hydrolase family 3 protein n=1 Tax=Meishania litoralis TaxID=3434685 RepID=A0ACC7LNZ8_9FLAO